MMTESSRVVVEIIDLSGSTVLEARCEAGDAAEIAESLNMLGRVAIALDHVSFGHEFVEIRATSVQCVRIRRHTAVYPPACREPTHRVIRVHTSMRALLDEEAPREVQL
jgi:hypothetical protein